MEGDAGGSVYRKCSLVVTLKKGFPLSRRFTRGEGEGVGQKAGVSLSRPCSGAKSRIAEIDKRHVPSPAFADQYAREGPAWGTLRGTIRARDPLVRRHPMEDGDPMKASTHGRQRPMEGSDPMREPNERPGSTSGENRES